MSERDLTNEELTFYANYALIEECDCCGDYFPITNHHDGSDYVLFNGRQFLCAECRNDLDTNS